jgi:hypothetical protein
LSPKKPVIQARTIARQPFLAATERDRRLGLSIYKGSNLRAALSGKELIRIHQANTGKRGGLIQLVEITDKGWEVLEDFKVGVKKPQGKGSFIHRFWQHKVQRWFLESFPGCKAVIEHSVLGKAVDVGVKVEGKRVAVEILIKGEEKELTNVIRDLEVGRDEAVICCEDRETIQRLKGRIEEIFGDRYGEVVKFKELREFESGAKDIG